MTDPTSAADPTPNVPAVSAQPEVVDVTDVVEVRDHNGDLIAKLSAVEEYVQVEAAGTVLRLSKGSAMHLSYCLDMIADELPWHHQDTKPDQPPVDNAHVVEGCEQFSGDGQAAADQQVHL